MKKGFMDLSSRFASDAEFRNRLRTDFENAIAEYELNDLEKEVILEKAEGRGDPKIEGYSMRAFEEILDKHGIAKPSNDLTKPSNEIEYFDAEIRKTKQKLRSVSFDLFIMDYGKYMSPVVLIALFLIVWLVLQMPWWIALLISVVAAGIVHFLVGRYVHSVTESVLGRRI